MISPITSFNSYNNIYPANINFYGIKRFPVREVKNLHALTCPRCGGPIIEPQKLTEAYRTISLPLRQMIKKGYLDESKNFPEIWALLNKFAEEFPTLSLDKILEPKERHDLFRSTIERTIAPGVDLKNRDLYNLRVKKFDGVESGIRKSARRELRSSAVVMNRLKSFLPYLKEIEKSEPFKAEVRGKMGAIEELLYYSTLYPRKTLSEIVNEPSIRAYNESMRDGLQEEFLHKQRIAFDKFRAVIRRKLKYTDEQLNVLQKQIMTTLFKSDKDPGVRLYNTLKLCKEFTENNNCQSIYYKLADIIKEIPEPPYNKYMELCNFLGEQNDSRIVESLLKPYVGSEEHVVARSMGGDDFKSNKISMHKGCNSRRSNISYEEYSEIYPMFPYNTCKQIDEVSNYIYRDRLIPKFYLYPIQISNTLRETTKGKIDPDVSSYCKKAYKKSQAKLEEHSRNIKELANERDSEIIELGKLRAQEESLRSKIETVNKENQQEIDAQKEERRISAYLNKVLEDKK